MFWMAGLGKLVATPAIHLSRFFLFFIFFYKFCTAQTQQGKGKPGGRAKKSRWSLGLSEIQTHHLPSVWLHPIVEKKTQPRTWWPSTSGSTTYNKPFFFFFLLYVINLFGMVTWMWLEYLSVSDDTSSLYLTIISLDSSPIHDSLNTFKTNTDSIQFNSIFLFTLSIINHLIWPHLKSSSHSLLNQSLPFTQSHAWTHLTQVLFQSFRSSLKKMIKALRWEWSEMYVPPRKWWSDDS